MTTIVYTGKTLPKTSAPHLNMVHCPTISTRLCADLRDKALALKIDHTQRLGVVVYSSTGVDALAKIADVLPIEHCLFWCVGSKTRAHLEAQFFAGSTYTPHIDTPEMQNFAGLLKHLHPQQDIPQTLLSIELVDTPRILSKHLDHPHILTIPAYESHACHQKQINAYHQSSLMDWAVLTSPKGAKGFVESLHKGSAQNFQIASIGPTTTAAIESLGYAIDYQPIHPNAESIIQHIAQVSTTV